MYNRLPGTMLLFAAYARMNVGVLAAVALSRTIPLTLPKVTDYSIRYKPVARLLSAINHGEFAIHGFRNRDLRPIFFPQTTDDKQQTRRHSAWISRKLRLLRAHALITKIVGTHRYQVTSTGRKIIVAILSALRSTVAQLTPVTAQLTAVAA